MIHRQALTVGAANYLGVGFAIAAGIMFIGMGLMIAAIAV